MTWVHFLEIHPYRYIDSELTALEMASCRIMHYRQTVIKIQRGRYGCIGYKEKVAVTVTSVNPPPLPSSVRKHWFKQDRRCYIYI